MTTLHPSPYLPSLREFRAGLRAHLTRLLTPDAAQAHARTELHRTLDAEAHHARMQRALLGGRL
ncbi:MULTISPECIES: hypothetical protein [unclassified Deinococcus]|uniref:hypothetical protein n=1 Tax=unclassified Deinococcus TaxID=2623546 RepID=UPI001C2FA421|nr:MULTISPECIES: hypothetical protein [unclassified Deinococcus]MDK2012918.1 hypothetical protein [Deinococcus sp. 43]